MLLLGLPRVFYTNTPPYAFKCDTQGAPPPVFSGSSRGRSVGGTQWGSVDRTQGREAGGVRDVTTGGTQGGTVGGTQGRTVGGAQSGAVGGTQDGAIGGVHGRPEDRSEGMTQGGTQRGFTNLSTQAGSNSEVQSYPWDSPSYNWDVSGSAGPARQNGFDTDIAAGSNGEAGPRPWDTPNYNWSMGCDTDQPRLAKLQAKKAELTLDLSSPIDKNKDKDKTKEVEAEKNKEIKESHPPSSIEKQLAANNEQLRNVIKKIRQ